MIFALLVAGAYALATLRRYSVAPTATLTTFALFISSGLTTLSAAPIDGHHSHNQNHHNYSMDHTWKFPCSAKPPIPPQKTRMVRHVAHRGLDNIKRQFNLANNKMNEYYPTVDPIYHNVTEKLKDQYNLPWLPTKQLEWYNNEVLCHDKSKKLALLLPKVDDALQIFAMTFYSLRHVNLTSNSNHDEVAKRNVFLDKMYHVLRGFLCELVIEMDTQNMTRPLIHEVDEVLKHMHWNQHVDFTEMVTQDSGVIRHFRNFILEWRSAMANAALRGDGTCDRSKTPPVTPKAPRRRKPNKKKKNGGKKRVKGQKQGRSARVSESRKKTPAKGGRRKGNNNVRRKLTGNKHRKTQ